MVAGPMGQYRQLRQTPAPSLFGVDTGPPHEGDTGQGVVLHTNLGPIKAMLHQSAKGGARAVLWAWGARGGYAGPAEAVYVAPRPLLIVHGLADTRLPPRCARQIYQWADEPKELVLYPGAEHGLRECKGELYDLLRRWIPEKLGDD